MMKMAPPNHLKIVQAREKWVEMRKIPTWLTYNLTGVLIRECGMCLAFAKHKLSSISKSFFVIARPGSRTRFLTWTEHCERDLTFANAKAILQTQPHLCKRDAPLPSPLPHTNLLNVSPPSRTWSINSQQPKILLRECVYPIAFAKNNTRNQHRQQQIIQTWSTTTPKHI